MKKTIPTNPVVVDVKNTSTHNRQADYNLEEIPTITSFNFFYSVRANRVPRTVENEDGEKQFALLYLYSSW
jgi:hypothetical protein